MAYNVFTFAVYQAAQDVGTCFLRGRYKQSIERIPMHSYQFKDKLHGLGYVTDANEPAGPLDPCIETVR